MNTTIMHDPPVGDLRQAVNVAIRGLGLVPSPARITNVHIPHGCRHDVTRLTAESWLAYDRLFPSDGWEHHVEPNGNPKRPLDYKVRDMFDGRMTVGAPLIIERPRMMVCPDCQGEGMRLQNAIAFLRNPALDERDVKFLPCGGCDGAGRVRRDPGATDPFGLDDGLIADDPGDIPF